MLRESEAPNAGAGGNKCGDGVVEGDGGEVVEMDVMDEERKQQKVARMRA